jgi:uncharacterized protein YqgV (UPF0045/DUF77 family)
MKLENLRSLIRESINEYIREIDNAGTKAGLEAKIAATEGAIEKREKMANMEGIDEAYHEMLDKGKMKEISNEVKALKRSLTKLQNQLSKLNSKSEPKAEVKDEVIDEMATEDDTQLGEDKESELGGKRVPKKFKDSYSTDWIEDKTAPKGKFSDKKSKGYFEVDEAKDGDDDDNSFYDDVMKLNESFLKMQKLAGVITEGQYNKKIEELDTNVAPEKKEDKNVSALITRLQQLKPQLKSQDTPPELKNLLDSVITLIQDLNKSQLTNQEAVLALTQLISDKRKEMNNPNKMANPNKI